MKPRKFRVVFEHDEGGWHVSIPKVKGCRTWGRTLEAGRAHVREALAACVDVFADAERVAATAIFEEDIRLPKGMLADVKKATAERNKLDVVAKSLRARQARLARTLTKEGLSLRDAGTLLGLSQEGVRQLLERSA